MAANARLVSLEGGVARLAANALACDLLRRRGCQPQLHAALEEASGRPLTLEWLKLPEDDQQHKPAT